MCRLNDCVSFSALCPDPGQGSGQPVQLLQPLFSVSNSIFYLEADRYIVWLILSADISLSQVYQYWPISKIFGFKKLSVGAVLSIKAVKGHY